MFLLYVKHVYLMEALRRKRMVSSCQAQLESLADDPQEICIEGKMFLTSSFYFASFLLLPNGRFEVPLPV